MALEPRSPPAYNGGNADVGPVIVTTRDASGYGRLMEILLAPELAPLTFAWGFLEAPLGPIADTLVEWARKNSPHVATEPVRGMFPDLLRALEPLTLPQTSELLVPTRSEWTAYFDNGARGGEPANAVGALAQMLGCRGIAVMSVPDTPTELLYSTCTPQHPPTS